MEKKQGKYTSPYRFVMKAVQHLIWNISVQNHFIAVTGTGSHSNISNKNENKIRTININ
jgi:hypothetical protein